MRKNPMRGESAKQVAIDVLRAARKPLQTKEIAKRVIESGRCSGLKGKTPEATIAATIAVGSKPGARSSVSARAPTRSPAPGKSRPRPSGPLPSGRAPRRRNRRRKGQRLPRRRATSPERPAAEKDAHERVDHCAARPRDSRARPSGRTATIAPPSAAPGESTLAQAAMLGLGAPTRPADLRGGARR